MLYVDFDGVLFDSNQETIANFEYSIKELCRINNLEMEIQGMKNFVIENRGKIGPIKDFFLIQKSFLSKHTKPIQSKEHFKKIKENIDFLELKFLEKRDHQKRLFSKWCLLHKPTLLANHFMDNKINFKIVSTKDEESIKDICSFFKLKPLECFGKRAYEEFGSKSNIIKKDIKELSVKTVALLDDNADHLSNDFFIKSYFVEWGYGKNKGYETVNENNFVKIVNLWT